MGTPKPTEPTAPPVAPPEPAPVPAPEVDPSDVAQRSVVDALEAIDQANPSVVTEPPADGEEVDPDPPVYDERGNVRPRGTPGAKPMTKAERVRIAARLQRGESIVTTAERKPSKS